LGLAVNGAAWILFIEMVVVGRLVERVLRKGTEIGKQNDVL
jgi:hypothetical protein